MRRTLMLTSLAFFFSINLAAQTAPPPVAPPVKPPAPRPVARPAAPRPITLTFQITDMLGAPLASTQVRTSGPVDREGVTAADGSLRLVNMRPGNYRLRFTREGSITLERDLTMRAGESLTVNASLSPSPVPPKAPEPEKPAVPEPVVKALPPPGDPRVTPVPLFLEKNFIGGREGRKDSSLGCTGTGTATLHQLREAWLSHLHEDADEWIYVVAGEGTLRIGTADQRVQAGTFSLVPYTMVHALLPQGRNPLIVISVLSGPPCAG
jgi:mannose-6-phosphate isomerase-like protein (cupin superfamily)